MRFIAFLVLLATLSCADLHPLLPNPTPEELAKMPSRWEAPELYIRLPENMRGSDNRIEIAKELCKEFAVRLYDAFDGQAYIPKFIICNPSVISEKQPGVMNLYDDGNVIIHHDETYMRSPPLRPGYSYCRMPKNTEYIPMVAGIMLHEWLHAHVGLLDEYKHAGEEGNNRTTSCPLHPFTGKAIGDNACVMDDSHRRELCRPGIHNADTVQGKEDCYSFVAHMLAQYRLAYIKVPTERIEGPYNPPQPIIEVRLK